MFNYFLVISLLVLKKSIYKIYTKKKYYLG